MMTQPLSDVLKTHSVILVHSVSFCHQSLCETSWSQCHAW